MPRAPLAILVAPLAAWLLAALAACDSGGAGAGPHDAATPAEASPVTPSPQIPATVECASPIGLSCVPGKAPVPCEATWADDSCTPAGGGSPCGGMLGMATANSGLLPGGEACVYDGTTRQLVAWVVLAADGPDCVLGTPGLSIPVACVETWNSAPRTGCRPYGAPRPWFCDTLPGNDDEGASCTDSSECNYPGGVCLFGPAYASSCGPGGVGGCSDWGTYDAGCAIDQGPACGCDGGLVPTCNQLGPAPWVGPCGGGGLGDAGRADSDAGDSGGARDAASGD